MLTAYYYAVIILTTIIYVVSVSGNDNCPRVALFTIARDTVWVVPDWLQYHGELFGYENIYFIDHGGTNPMMRDIYSYLQTEKHMTIAKLTGIDFPSKHSALSKLAHSVSANYDILFFLDSDEFLTVRNNNKISISREDICAELVSLYANTSAVRLKMPNIMCPCRQPNESEETHGRMADCTDFLVEPHTMLSKTFHRADSFQATDQGNHYGCTKNQTCGPLEGDYPTDCFPPEVLQKMRKCTLNDFELTKLSLMHFPCGGYRQWRRKYMMRGFAYGYDEMTPESINQLQRWQYWKYIYPEYMNESTTFYQREFPAVDEKMEHITVLSEYVHRNQLGLVEFWRKITASGQRAVNGECPFKRQKRPTDALPNKTEGWFDILGQGCANDYCRWVQHHGKVFWSCALAGTNEPHTAPGYYEYALDVLHAKFSN